QADLDQLQLALFRAEEGKELDQCEARVRTFLTLYPDWSALKGVLGWVLAQRGSVAEGLRLMEEVAEANARDLSFHEHLGDVCRLAGKPEQARAAWQKALTLFPGTTEPGDWRKKAIEDRIAALK